MQNKDLCILMLSHFNLASVSVSAGREGPEFVRVVCERFFLLSQRPLSHGYSLSLSNATFSK